MKTTTCPKCQVTYKANTKVECPRCMERFILGTIRNYNKRIYEVV